MKLAVMLIYFYQFGLKSFLGIGNGVCRYSPTCSIYIREAIVRYGILHGVSVGMKRLIKCNPLFSGGFDPLPRI